MKSETIALVSAIVAAVSAAGSIASALVSYYNGKRQVEGAQVTAEKQIAAAHAAAQLQIASAQSVAHKQLLMPMREAWIGRLRDKIAKYLAICSNLRVSEGKFDPSEVDTLGLLSEEISLMLNLDEQKHSELSDALQELIGHGVLRKPKFHDAVEGIRKLAREILRTEWQRAKSGE